MMYIDGYEAGWVSNLTELWLGAEPHLSNYLLIDGAFLPGIQDKIARVVGREDVYCLFAHLPSYTQLTKQVAPFLVRVRGISDKLAELLQTCSGMPMVSTISTIEDINQLGARLASWCIVECEGQRFNLRYADTRRLPALCAALGPDKLRSLVGPASQWALINREGCWTELELPMPSTLKIEEIKRLTSGEFDRLVSDSEPDEVLNILRYSGAALPVKLSRAHQLLSIAIHVCSFRQMSVEQKLKWCSHFLKESTLSNESLAQEIFLAWSKSEF